MMGEREMTGHTPAQVVTNVTIRCMFSQLAPFVACRSDAHCPPRSFCGPFLTGRVCDQ